jgi:hypothetical protein
MVIQLFRVSCAGFLKHPLFTFFILFFAPVAPFIGQAGQPAACDKRRKFDLLKKRCGFSSAGPTLMLQTTQYSQPQLIKLQVIDKLIIVYSIIESQYDINTEIRPFS